MGRMQGEEEGEVSMSEIDEQVNGDPFPRSRMFVCVCLLVVNMAVKVSDF